MSFHLRLCSSACLICSLFPIHTEIRFVFISISLRVTTLCYCALSPSAPHVAIYPHFIVQMKRTPIRYSCCYSSVSISIWLYLFILSMYRIHTCCFAFNLLTFVSYFLFVQSKAYTLFKRTNTTKNPIRFVFLFVCLHSISFNSNICSQGKWYSIEKVPILEKQQCDNRRFSKLSM